MCLFRAPRRLCPPHIYFRLAFSSMVEQQVFLPQPSYPQAESVAKARLWLPPDQLPGKGVLGNPARLVSKVRETEVSFHRGKKAEEQKEVPTAEKPRGQLQLQNEPGKQATWESLPLATAVSPTQSSRAQQCLQSQCRWAGICSKLDLELRLAISQ